MATYHMHRKSGDAEIEVVGFSTPHQKRASLRLIDPVGDDGQFVLTEQETRRLCADLQALITNWDAPMEFDPMRDLQPPIPLRPVGKPE